MFQASRLPVPLRSALVFAAAAAGLFLVGSFVDLPLAESLYYPNNAFGVAFAAYGESPALLALVAAGTLAVLALPDVHRVLRILLASGGSVLILVGTIALVFRPEEYWPAPLAARILIAVVLAGATVWAVSRVSAGATWQAMCVLAAALFAVVVVEMVLVQGVKILWERPRMRMLAETGAPFAPWWSPGYEQKDALLVSGVGSSEFTSFPSGHSANAAVAMMMVGFTLLREDLKRLAVPLFWIGAAWSLLVAFSRLTMGAHFLSDTAVGVMLTLATILGATAGAIKALDAGWLERLPRDDPSTSPGTPRHARGTE